tara:strand:+ start:466 stop:1035 length:570 start_codon:yes stop_codon:yes gene_type:complete
MKVYVVKIQIDEASKNDKAFARLEDAEAYINDPKYGEYGDEIYFRRWADGPYIDELELISDSSSTAQTLACEIAEHKFQLRRKEEQLRGLYTYVSVSTYTGSVDREFDTYKKALDYVASNNLDLPRYEDKWHRGLLLLAPYRWSHNGKLVHPSIWRDENWGGSAVTVLSDSTVDNYHLYGIEKHNMHWD